MTYLATFALHSLESAQGHSAVGPSVQDIVQEVAGVATALGVPVALTAGLVALRSFRTQANAQRLQAILTTNEQWQDVGEATSAPITLSAGTITAIRRAYAALKFAPAMSAVQTRKSASDLTLRAPFIAAALFPAGNPVWEEAPNTERPYLANVYARTLALGYVRTVLANDKLSPWISTPNRATILAELGVVDKAMEKWVGLMNEIAELYECNLLDRQLFVRKRSVALIQRLFAAEPYILWRNSTTPGRWGLRVLGIGAEARYYHWSSHLQRAAIRLRTDPAGYSSFGSYPGFGEALGWIIGPGTIAKRDRGPRRSERAVRAGLGFGFSDRSKQLQNEVIKSLPTDRESGLPPGPFEWLDTADENDPVGIRSELARLRGS